GAPWGCRCVTLLKAHLNDILCVIQLTSAQASVSPIIRNSPLSCAHRDTKLLYAIQRRQIYSVTGALWCDRRNVTDELRIPNCAQNCVNAQFILDLATDHVLSVQRR